MGFGWDPVKAAATLRTRGLSFKEGSTIFANVLPRMEATDDREDYGEERIQAIGMSDKGKILFVAYTLRPGNVIWIISVRYASKKERKKYARYLEDCA